METKAYRITLEGSPLHIFGFFLDWHTANFALRNYLEREGIDNSRMTYNISECALTNIVGPVKPQKKEIDWEERAWQMYLAHNMGGTKGTPDKVIIDYIKECTLPEYKKVMCEQPTEGCKVDVPVSDDEEEMPKQELTEGTIVSYEGEEYIFQKYDEPRKPEDSTCCFCAFSASLGGCRNDDFRKKHCTKGEGIWWKHKDKSGKVIWSL